MEEETAWLRFMRSGTVADYLSYCSAKNEVEVKYDRQNQSHRSETHFSVRTGQNAVSPFTGLRSD